MRTESMRIMLLGGLLCISAAAGAQEIKEDTLARQLLQRDTLVQPAAARDTAVRNETVRDTVVRDTVVRNEVVRDTVVRNEVVRDTVVQYVVVRDTVTVTVPAQPAVAAQPAGPGDAPAAVNGRKSKYDCWQHGKYLRLGYRMQNTLSTSGSEMTSQYGAELSRGRSYYLHASRLPVYSSSRLISGWK